MAQGHVSTISGMWIGSQVSYSKFCVFSVTLGGQSTNFYISAYGSAPNTVGQLSVCSFFSFHLGFIGDIMAIEPLLESSLETQKGSSQVSMGTLIWISQERDL